MSGTESLFGALPQPYYEDEFATLYHAGSGSTLVAATLEGRRSIGIEIEERYAAVAAHRLAEVATIVRQVEAA